MADIAMEMKNYLSETLQDNFCLKIASVIQATEMHTRVREGFLQRWDQQEKSRFDTWFGTTDDLAKFRIQTCLQKICKILKGLKCDDFLPLTPEIAKTLGCSADKNTSGVVAAVCQIPGVHKIMLSHAFFELRPISFTFDSQVATLIHEIAHFPEVLGTRGLGETYSFSKARLLARHSPIDALNNSDNIAAYVLFQE